MFEAVELGRKISKNDFEAEVPQLRTRLLKAQFGLRHTHTPLIVVINGVEGSGKAELLNRLAQWFDVRGINFLSFSRHTDEEAMRPKWWRYWRTLPPRGKIGVFLSAWYTNPIDRRVMDKASLSQFEQELTEIRLFERMLVQDGAFILKFWLHLSKKDQKRRLKKLENDPENAWRVTKNDWIRHKAYRNFERAHENAIRHTDTAEAPWFLVEAKNARYRDLTIGQTIVEAMEKRLAAGEPTSDHSVLPPITASVPQSQASVTILDHVDLTQTIGTDNYRSDLKHQQARLGSLGRKMYNQKRSTVIVFEGWDAAGKGGAIRRLSGAFDARSLHVISIGAPTDEERAQHYLWRFWRHIPRSGHITIYDRSWYGRVMVERVEGFARTNEWSRAFAEINDFEEHLVGHGIVLLKFFVHISPEEQLARFKERESVPYKRHKLTDEDWRNREKWPQYETAINEMVARTSTSHAPWDLIAGNDKRFARVDILRRVADRLEKALK